MNISTKFNQEAIKEIAKKSGSKAVKDSISYITAPFICGSKGFYTEIIDNVAFFAGNITKKHFRLYEIAVIEDKQKEGYGSFMIMRIKQLCQKKGIPKITLRTSKDETAIDFYRKQGGRIVGEKDNDWEVEILL